MWLYNVFDYLNNAHIILKLIKYKRDYLIYINKVIGDEIKRIRAILSQFLAALLYNIGMRRTGIIIDGYKN